MKDVKVTISGNNKFLRKLFRGTKVTKHTLTLGKLDQDFLRKNINSLDLKYDYKTYQISNIELEGEFEKWDAIISLKIS